MKLINLVFFCYLTFLSIIVFANKISAPEDFWKDGFFNQTTVDMSLLDNNQLKAKIDGGWNIYSLVSFPEKIMNWNIKRRLKAIEDIQNNTRPELAGPHNGIVATYGYKREDSLFKLNNSVKGMGFLPKKNEIKKLIKLLQETKDNPFQERLNILKSLYNNANDLFDLRAQVSLELYSTPEFVTQTFLNQAVNPLSTVVFLDIPSYKFKAITRLIDDKNPSLTDYEKDVLIYTNLIHSYFHGEFQRQFIAVIYYCIEIYDNSPGKPDGKGKKIAPAFL